MISVTRVQVGQIPVGRPLARKFIPKLLIALLLALPAALHAADFSLLSEGKFGHQIVMPDLLETLALTECLNQTARLVQTTFAENGAEVAVVTESQRDATKPALLLGNTRFAKQHGVGVTKLYHSH